MPALAVRSAVLDDITALVALAEEHARLEHVAYEVEGKAAKLAAALFEENPRLRAWIGITDEKVVGYATASEEFSTWAAAPFLHMDCLFVRRGYRGGGLGAALLQAVCDYACKRGLQQVQWQTPAWNTDASRFYERHGAIAHQKIRFSLSIDITRSVMASDARQQSTRVAGAPHE